MSDNDPDPNQDNIIPFAPRPAQDTTPQPFINLPPFTKTLVFILVGVHILVGALPEPTQFDVLEHLGFVPAYYTGAIPFDLYALAGPITFAFLHGSWAHLLINSVMLVAFGAGLEPWMGWKRLALMMLACSLVSALVQLGFDIGSTNPVIGASGALSGLFPAALLMMQDRGGMSNPGRYGYWPLIAIWIGVSVLFGVIGGPQGETIAWPAHIGGFLAGFLLYRPIMRCRL